MRRISRRCHCSAQSVRNWVRDYAREHDENPPLTDQVVMLEVDAMGHYLKKKPANFGYGKPWIVIQDSALTGHVGIVIKDPAKSSMLDSNKDTEDAIVQMHIRSLVRLCLTTALP